MAMSYGRAKAILESVKDIEEDKLATKLAELELTEDDLEKARLVVNKGEAVLMGADLSQEFEDSYNENLLESYSVADLAELEIRYSMDESANEEKLKKIRKILRDNHKIQKGLNINSVLAADYLIESGIVDDERQIKYINSRLKKYDRQTGLDNVALFEKVSSLMETMTISEKAKRKIDSYFSDVTYSQEALDAYGNPVINEKGEVVYTKITDKEIKKQNDEIMINAAELDGKRKVLENAKGLKLEECKDDEEIVARLQAALDEETENAVVANVAVASAASQLYEESLKTVKDAGGKLKQHARNLLRKTKAVADDLPKHLNVSVVQASVARSVSETETLAKRAAVKVKDNKAVSWLREKAKRVDGKAKELWGKRYEIQKNIAANRWRYIVTPIVAVGTNFFVTGAATVLGGSAVAGTGAAAAYTSLAASTLAGLSMPAVAGVAAAAIGGYVAYSVAANKYFPIIAQANKMVSEAKEKGEKLKFGQAYRKAKEALEKDESYNRRFRNGAVAGVIGGAVMGAVAGACALPGVGNWVTEKAGKGGSIVLMRLLSRLSISGGALSAQISDYKDAKLEVKKNPQDEKAKSRKNWTLFGLIASGTAMAATALDGLTDGLSSDGATQVDAKELSPEDIYQTTSERALTDTIPTADQDSLATDSVNAEAPVVEEVVPAPVDRGEAITFERPFSDEELAKSIRSYFKTQDAYEDYMSVIHEFNLQSLDSRFANFSDTQVAYALSRVGAYYGKGNNNFADIVKEMACNPDKIAVSERVGDLAEFGATKFSMDAAKTFEGKPTYIGQNLMGRETKCRTVDFDRISDDCVKLKAEHHDFDCGCNEGDPQQEQVTQVIEQKRGIQQKQESENAVENNKDPAQEVKKEETTNTTPEKKEETTNTTSKNEENKTKKGTFRKVRGRHCWGSINAAETAHPIETR